ncbi:MAG TPA: SCO family protein [Alphaproteobacteria bacterium]|jgi:protein SCO1/2
MNAQPSPPAGPSARRRLVLVGLSATVAALLAAALVLWLRPAPEPAVVAAAPGATNNAVLRLPAGTDLGGPFNLVDQDDRPVTDATFAGKFMLIYFGFTYCPDVCPTEMQTMATAIDELGPSGDKVQPMLISVDPERDRPSQLKDYVAAFHPRMMGLTGTDEQIAAVAKAYRVYYSKNAPDADGAYNVDHTSFVYLMGPDGKLRSVFRGGASPELMVAELKAQLAK